MFAGYTVLSYVLFCAGPDFHCPSPPPTAFVGSIGKEHKATKGKVHVLTGGRGLGKESSPGVGWCSGEGRLVHTGPRAAGSGVGQHSGSRKGTTFYAALTPGGGVVLESGHFERSGGASPVDFR